MRLLRIVWTVSTLFLRVYFLKWAEPWSVEVKEDGGRSMDVGVRGVVFQATCPSWWGHCLRVLDRLKYYQVCHGSVTYCHIRHIVSESLWENKCKIGQILLALSWKRNVLSYKTHSLWESLVQDRPNITSSAVEAWRIVIYDTCCLFYAMSASFCWINIWNARQATVKMSEMLLWLCECLRSRILLMSELIWSKDIDIWRIATNPTLKSRIF